MFRKIQDAVQLLNHDYIQDFSVGAETRTQDIKRYPDFWKKRVGRMEPFLSMGGGKERAGTRGMRSSSADFWSGRLFMTGTRQAFRDATITVRQIRTPPLCIGRTAICVTPS